MILVTDKQAGSFTVFPFVMFQRRVSNIVSEVQQTALLRNTMNDKMKRDFERNSDSIELLQEEALATMDNFLDPYSIVAPSYMQRR